MARALASRSESLQYVLEQRANPGFKWKDAFFADEDLGPEEGGNHKRVYLVTLPHPAHAMDGAGGALRSPGEFPRRKILDILLNVFAEPMAGDAAARHRGRNGNATRLLQCVVFQEKHALNEHGEREIHYHIALLASSSFRFQAYKRALRERHGLASHWSDTHIGYWSTVRYGWMPTPKKPQSELDPTPLTWCHDGPHPDLFDSVQEPVTAEALRRQREFKVKTATEAGKPEPKATELDLYAVVVREGFRNTPDDPWAHKKLIEHIRLKGGTALFNMAWRIRHRLAALIDDVWSWETVSDDLAMLRETRLERFGACAHGQCCCQGAWRQAAEWMLWANGLDKRQLCQDIYRSIAQGRHESLPVVCLVGRFGGEGKSFFLAPLRRMYGRENVQPRPQPGNFPLIDLEKKRVAVLDEWDFDEKTLPLSTQLLWFEGKDFPITRPQNKDYTGHLLYKGTAPVFITCKELHVKPIVRAAQEAINTGNASQETMLLRRLRLYWLSEKLPLPEGVQIPECPTCFAQLVVHYAGGGA